jgi:hypothetical protein
MFMTFPAGRWSLHERVLARVLCASLVIAGCSRNDDEGDGGVIDEPDLPGYCDPTTNDDSMTRAFVIDSFLIPETDNIGFNVDHIITTTPRDVAGCHQVDGAPGGIDNAFALIVDAVNDVAPHGQVAPFEIDRRHAFDDSVLHLTLRHWNGTSDDDCVRVDLSSALEGEPLTVHTRDASLRDGMLEYLWFPKGFRFAPALNLLGDGGVNRVVVPMTVMEPTARIVFDAAMTEIVVSSSPNTRNSSILGGYVLYSGTESRAFQPAFEAALASTGSPLVPDLLASISQLLDLDSTPWPSLWACTSADGGATSADSFSVGLLMSGHHVTTP